jgi:hypothetical protein
LNVGSWTSWKNFLKQSECIKEWMRKHNSWLGCIASVLEIAQGWRKGIKWLTNGDDKYENL